MIHFWNLKFKLSLCNYIDLLSFIAIWIVILYFSIFLPQSFHSYDQSQPHYLKHKDFTITFVIFFP